MTRRKEHPAYAAIVAMNWQVVPLLLEKLKTLPDYWFGMLRDITDENPVAFDHRGYYHSMVNDWLDWDEKRKKRMSEIHKHWDILERDISALLENTKQDATCGT